MQAILDHQPLWTSFSLFLSLFFVLAFEFINGFHDTANAVATVIYTRAMSPYRAVFLSGCFNFLGVLLGGVGVAYAIIHLLPVELLIDANSGRGAVMVFSLLAAAILWNLGTWYFGIPASSSHTLIGAILGVSLANALLNHIPVAAGANWQKALEIALSLILSPLCGFALAGLIFLGLKYWKPDSPMHKTPEARKQENDKKHPPFWNRLTLICSSMTVSFVHGSNDGQKGVGLVMLVLIGILPGQFVLDLNSPPWQVEQTREAVRYLDRLYLSHADTLEDLLALKHTPADAKPDLHRCDPGKTRPILRELNAALSGISDFRELDENTRIRVRRHLLCLDDGAKKVIAQKRLPERDAASLTRLRKDLTTPTEYAPWWVIFAIASALGVGTMVGWRRVVQTVGERIGRQGMTYAQGLSAEVTASLAIGIANLFSLPVSTTHVLSSGVAGTMVVNKSGLQTRTVRNILLAWVFTLPIAILLAAFFFWLGSLLI
ncbi:MAG: inorganic phosphate transporter [Zoogloeaceae bacterium]|jgi:low-affinity inorganic phosphate transporter|nr:inorganic phosphate transporter [Zoogloeaceae bacterium]